MGIFAKREGNASATVECVFDKDVLVKKSDVENFSAGMSLIVRESQEALFFLNGRALDLFAAGSHSLRAEKLPLLSRILKLPSGAKTPFRSELYFINVAEQMGVTWGTDTQITYTDPKFNDTPFELGARGEASLHIADSRRFLTKLVGTQNGIDREQTIKYFKALLLSNVMNHLPNVLHALDASIYDIDSHITACSHEIKKRLNDDLSSYGVEVPMFKIIAFQKPVSDPNYIALKNLRSAKVVDIGFESVAIDKEMMRQDLNARGVIVDSEAQAKKRENEKYTYQEEQAFKAAGATDPTAAFASKVEQLKIMLDKGVLTNDEFNAMKQKLLDEVFGTK